MPPVISLPVIHLGWVRRAAMQGLAIAGTVATLVIAVRAGPPGWDGPFLGAGAMVRLYSLPLDGPSAQPIPAATPAAIRLTLSTVGPMPTTAVTVLRDGFAAAKVEALPGVLMVHDGDVLTLLNDGDRPATIQVSATPELQAPAAGPWVVAAHGRRQLPSVVLRDSAVGGNR